MPTRPIDLLPLGALDLKDLIRKELVSNPALELARGELSERRVHLPDLSVERMGSQWYVRFEEASLPEVGVRRGAGTDEQAREARRLVESLEYRRGVLLRVADRVMLLQAGFLDYGRGGARPLSLTLVAGKTGLAEETIARAIAGKSIKTPHGVFELDWFFAQPAVPADRSPRASEASREVRPGSWTDHAIFPCFFFGFLAGLAYLYAVWELASVGVARPRELDVAPLIAGVLIGLGGLFARRSSDHPERAARV